MSRAPVAALTGGTVIPRAGRRRRSAVRAGLRVLAAGALVLLLATCSGGPTEEAADHLAELCGTDEPGVPVQALPYEADTGEGVDGFVLGEGTRGVIFSNQTDTFLCDWLPFAKRVAADDRRALIYDYSYKPDAAEEVEAAAGELAKLGADEVVLVGASKGAVGSLAAAPSIGDPKVAGVASLSAVGHFEGLDSLKAAKRVRAPLLIMAARNDATTDAGEVAPKLARASPSKDKRVVVFGGAEHGIDLLEGEHGAEARSLLKGFVERNLPQD